MKKTEKITTILTLAVAFCFILVTLVQPAESKELCVIVERANVREKPTTQSKIVDTLLLDEVIVKLGSKGNWYRVRLANGKHGWIHKNLVKLRAINPFREWGDYFINKLAKRLDMKFGAEIIDYKYYTNSKGHEILLAKIGKGNDWVKIEVDCTDGVCWTTYSDGVVKKEEITEEHLASMVYEKSVQQ